MGRVPEAGGARLELRARPALSLSGLSHCSWLAVPVSVQVGRARRAGVGALCHLRRPRHQPPRGSGADR
eukprot:7395132-Pyramimonas_sp.AAC.1